MTSLFSPRWHRVAALRLRLVPQLVPRRQRVRGQTWFVLVDPASGRGLRLNAAAYAIAARLDGSRTVQATWEAGLGGPVDPPTQDEVLALLAQLREAGFLQLERDADFDLLLPHFETTDAARRAQGSPLAWRLPLLDPTPWLVRLLPLQRRVFTRTALGLWLAAVASLVVLALQNAPLLAAHAREALTSPRLAALALGLMVPVKAMHELAHALAVRRLGGVVRLAGVTLMMGMPLPWVDASASAGFVRRRDRVLVGAAGMMSELALAAVALPAWLWLHARGDGWLADALFATLAITGVSTLLFNANPLQRFDGYFLLVDALELPNLATRSRQWWFAALRRRLQGLPPGNDEPLPVARGEAAWLAAYAPLAWLYAVALATAAALWLAGLWLPLGVAGGALLAAQALRAPISIASELRRAALAQRSGARRWRRGVLAAVLAAAAILLAPWPQRTIVQGVVWPADQAQLRAGEDGFVDAIVVREGQAIAAGDVVLRLANPALAAQVARQTARVASLEATLVDAQLANDAPAPDANAGDARAELASAQAELDRLHEREAGLVVRAQVAGRVALGPVGDLPGRFFHRGALVGQVLTGAPPTVRMAWRQADLDALGTTRAEPRAVTVRLAGSRALTHAAVVARDGAGAVGRLPSAALSERHGGPIATDPKDAEDLKPLEPVVLVDVRRRPRGGRCAGRRARGAHRRARVGAARRRLRPACLAVGTRRAARACAPHRDAIVSAPRSLALTLPRPGPAWGSYPLRSPDMPPAARGLAWRTPARRCAALAARSIEAEARWAALENGAPAARAQAHAALRARLRREGLCGEAIADALGLVARCARRTLGWAPRANQRQAAAALLDGRMAEMATGEGKTLAIALAAAVAALAGVPVHVVTANAYLAARDAARLAPFYATLGLAVGALVPGEGAAARRAGYARDIVYATARELAFDYLRDGQGGTGAHDAPRAAAALAGAPLARRLMRGLCMAILDEADSILLDEAEVPLILSRDAPHAARRAFLWQALAIARQLEPGVDFVVQPGERSVALGARGEERLAALAIPLGGPWLRPRYRREAVTIALAALHAFRRNEHYVVRAGQVEILDEVTGRIADGRRWSRGLHTVVALKEGLAPPPETETLAQITFQRFFQRYWRLAGLSGTLFEARAELRSVYGTGLVAIGPHRSSRRRTLPPRRFPDAAALHAAVAARVEALSAAGRPVLVGTDSVAASETVARVLAVRGIPHVVLNALNDAEEAAIVAGAGAAGRVTVATRLAGRGTDIALDARARAAGGLHVIDCQDNPSHRLDRQLAGRAARAATPGAWKSGR